MATTEENMQMKERTSPIGVPDDIKYPHRHVMGESASSEHFIAARAERERATAAADAVEEVVEFGTADLETFPSGAVRGSQEGKSRVDLLDPRFILRVGHHMASQVKDRAGALNYTKGIPSSRYIAGLLRHVLQYYAGDRTEDHLSAVVFNAQGLAMNEGTDLDDLHRWDGS